MENAINTTATAATAAVAVNGPGRIFSGVFNDSDVVDITFDAGWSNGTGYLDGAVKAPIKGLEAPGSIGRCRDQHGRRVLVVRTRFGNVVVFDRYTGQEQAGVYVSNAPSNPLIRLAVSDSSVTEDEMNTLFGGWGILEDNLGFAIEKIAKLF